MVSAGNVVKKWDETAEKEADIMEFGAAASMASAASHSQAQSQEKFDLMQGPTSKCLLDQL